MPAEGDMPSASAQSDGQDLSPEPLINKEANVRSWVDQWAPINLPPWLNIMLRPRRTIRAIVDEDPGKYWIVLAGLSGVLSAQIDWGLSWLSRLVTQVLLGALLGLIVIYIAANFLYVFGWIFKGKATQKEVLAAIVWTRIPNLIAGVMKLGIEAASWILMGESYAAAPPHAALDFIAGILQLLIEVLFVWSLGIFVLSFAEVNRFSVWRSVGAILSPFLVVGTCFGLLILPNLL